MSIRAVVTGGSSGIGRATVDLLAKHGYDVGVLSNDVVGVDGTVRAVRQDGGKAFPVHFDLGVVADCEGLVGRLEDEHGPIDLLVNCAGIGLQSDVVETELTDVTTLASVNYLATIVLCRDALRAMATRRKGHIINVTSLVAHRALPGLSIYASTKAGVHGFTQALRIEARDVGVHVTEVLPMSVRTPFFDQATNRSRTPYGPGRYSHPITPERLAELIWRAIQKPVAEVYTSGFSRIYSVLDAMAPSLLDSVLTRERRRRAAANHP
jgi:short-subunit dehydrogenase